MKRATLILAAIAMMAGISRGDSWTLKANYGGLSRKSPGVFSIGNKGYVGGGYNIITGTPINDFWEWNQATNVWTQKADYPGSSGYFTVSFTIDSLGYMGLGDTGTGQDFYAYSPTTNTWTQKANYPQMGRDWLIGFSIRNKGYAGTGVDINGNTYNDFYEYNPATDIWTQKANFAGGNRGQMVGFAIGDKGYVGLGDSLDNFFMTEYFDFWAYDPNTNIWTQKDSFPGAWRGTNFSFVIGSKGYFGPGFFGGYFNDFWEYDALTNHWTQKLSFPYGLWAAVGFSIGDTGYVYTGDSATNQFYKYDADSITGIQTLTPSSLQTSLYPNPFTDKTTLTIAGNPQNATLNIFNIEGQKVKSLFIGNKKEIVVNRDDLSEGIYFYELISSNAQTLATGKMVVE